MTYVTASGVKVRSTGPAVMRDGTVKIPCVRVGGGWHGWLRRDRLKPFRREENGVPAR